MKKLLKNKILIIVLVLFSIISFLYGFLIKSIGSGTKFYLVWFFIGIIFLVLAYMSYKNMWRSVPKIVRLIIIGIVIICGSIFIIVECIIIKEFGKEEKKNLDMIIVLGAQVYENSPSVVLKYRLDKAIEYLNENDNTICVVSGGQGYNEKYPEAIIMQKYLIENGINEDKVLIEGKSKNTEENIKNSMQYIGEDKFVGIVTNNFHIYRAIQTAKKVGLNDVYGVVAKSDYITLPNNLLREFFAVFKECLKKRSKKVLKKGQNIS